jgi:membrane associated rhomboid family serine protease
VKEEKEKLIRSMNIPALLLALMWFLMFFQWYFSFNLYFLGIYPLHFNGLQGVITSVLIHGNWGHLLGNSAPFFIFSTALFYFYPKISTKVFFGMWITSGFYLWLFARDNWHIGASGLIYSLAFFHLTIALLKREMKIVSFSMLIIFLYGSMVWGFFPEFYPKENISWEGHLMGATVGVIFAFFFKSHAPQSKKYFEDEDEDLDDDNPYWMSESDENTH